MAPWYFLPVCWAFLGIVFSGLNSLGYDCGSGAFSRNRAVDWIVGNFVSLPLLFPFENYRFTTKTRNYEKMLDTIVSSPVWYFSSFGQWIYSNFALRSSFRPGHRLKMIGSMSITYLSAAIYFSLMLYFGGFWTLCKYWLLPWLAYHAWMSVFITTAYHCKEVGDKKQRTIVVYCRYPRWVDLLANDMNNVMASEHCLKFREKLRSELPNYRIRPFMQDLKTRLNTAVEETTWGAAMKSKATYAVKSLNQIKWGTAFFLGSTFCATVWALFNPGTQADAHCGFHIILSGGLGHHCRLSPSVVSSLVRRKHVCQTRVALHGHWRVPGERVVVVT